MRSGVATADEYLASLPEDRRAVMTELRKAIRKSIPKGFKEGMGYGNMGWVVPHSMYPAGYHCDPKTPLPGCWGSRHKNHIGPERRTLARR